MADKGISINDLRARSRTMDFVQAASKRKVSDAARTLRKLPSRVGILHHTDEDTDTKETQRNLSNLVEVLSTELKKLQSSLEIEKKQQRFLSDYLSNSHQVYRAEVERLYEILQEKQQFRDRMISDISKILAQPSTHQEKIDHLLSLLINEDLENESINPSGCIDFPSFSSWVEQFEDQDNANCSLSADSADSIDLESISCVTLVEPQIAGFRVENGFVLYAPDSGTESYGIAPTPAYYKAYFYENNHSNFVVDSSNSGTIVASILTDDLKTIILARMNNETKFLDAPRQKNRKKFLTQALQLQSPIWREIKDTSFQDSLLDFEAKELQMRRKYKIALINCRDERTENEIFSINETSSDYEEFLDFLGTRVCLEGWNHYAGGLDTKSNTSGTHSIYTKYEDVEIMFHVSTLLPFSECDEQQVERKRFLGNDVVVVVFKEGEQPFSPQFFRSHFNCVFIVIQKLNLDENHTYYQMATCSRQDVKPFPPYISNPPIYKQNQEFRKILLSKMINAERTVHKTTEFEERLIRARTTAIQTLMKDL